MYPYQQQNCRIHVFKGTNEYIIKAMFFTSRTRLFNKKKMFDTLLRGIFCTHDAFFFYPILFIISPESRYIDKIYNSEYIRIWKKVKVRQTVTYM